MASTSSCIEDWPSDNSEAKCNLHLLTQDMKCDVNFRVGAEEQVVRAHRYLLVYRSSVFKAMLCGPMAEKNDIFIPDVSVDDFKYFLRYLYSTVPEITPDNVTALLYLAKKYAIANLQSSCIQYLQNIMSDGNVCDILEQAHSFDERVLVFSALDFIQKNYVNVLGSAGFKELCSECFRRIMSYGIEVKPEYMFNACVVWSVAECCRKQLNVTAENQRKVIGHVMYEIYFPDMDKANFVKYVIPSKILTAAEQVKVLSSYICPDVDVAPFKTRAQRRVLRRTETFTVDIFEEYMKSDAGKSVLDNVFFMCHSNILLHGFRLFGSGRQHVFPHRYVVKIYQVDKIRSFGRLVFDTDITASGASDKHGVADGIFGFPFPLRRNVSYHIEVTLTSGDPPLYVGCSSRSQLEVGGCTFRITSGRAPAKIIANLICSSQSLGNK